MNRASDESDAAKRTRAATDNDAGRSASSGSFDKSRRQSVRTSRRGYEHADFYDRMAAAETVMPIAYAKKPNNTHTEKYPASISACEPAARSPRSIRSNHPTMQ